MRRPWHGYGVARIATAVVTAIERGPDGESILYFPDRAAYLAYFLGELAGGRAWGRWSLAEFEPLRSLPPGTAAVEALARQPAWAEATLLHLAGQGKLDRVLGLMTERDARLALDLAAGTDIGTGSRPQAEAVDRSAADALLTLWAEQAPLWGRTDWHAAVTGLRLYIEVRRRNPELSPGRVRPAIEHLIRLADLARTLHLSSAELARLAIVDLDAAADLARRTGVTGGIAGLAAFAAAAAGDAAWLAGAHRGRAVRRASTGFAGRRASRG